MTQKEGKKPRSFVETKKVTPKRKRNVQRDHEEVPGCERGAYVDVAIVRRSEDFSIFFFSGDVMRSGQKSQTFSYKALWKVCSLHVAMGWTKAKKIIVLDLSKMNSASRYALWTS